MIVTLEDAVFASPNVDPVLLLRLLHHGFEGRHILLTDPFFKRSGSHNAHAWLAARDPLVRDVAIEALNRGVNAIQGATTVVNVRVADRAQSHWHGKPPSLTPEDAALLMALPLHLVLEDRLSDKHFLLCVLPRPKREELRRALERGWCRAENGGGIGNMRRYVKSLRGEHAERLRTWFLFDRDTEPSGAPSKQSELLRQDCQEQSLPHHQLRRRSIENYLPPPALEWWSGLYQGEGATSERQKLVREFMAMAATDRHHLDMKEHFEKDIADLFREERFRIDPAWLDADQQRPELDDILTGLFERM